MSSGLKLFFHPLSSFCHKVLIALYENNTLFEPVVVDLGSADSSAEMRRLWPIAKFPLLRDDARNQTVPESSIIIEYLAQHYPGPSTLIGKNEDFARDTRLKDRFYDLHVQVPMQKIVGDRIRPQDQRDPLGVSQARAALKTALDIAEKDLAGKTWVMGDMFTMADCAAAPALFYANLVLPYADTHKTVTAYFERLKQRPSYARVLKEAEPFMQYFPRD
ncbi:MAG: glutathione S-transferase family protein [Rhodospirillaceae bacterium]|nr:glutathione S-transferase family protein [Rhodospirillaceae bacterium]